MKKIKVFAPAKVNFALDIVGKENGYHNIKTVVSTVSFGDEIVLKKRKDDRISLKVIGSAGCPAGENNAFKAGKLFKKTFKTSGFDIVLKKKIPVGSGLGGSSADAAGVLNGLKALFKVNADLNSLANALGSDTAYMLLGGFALLKGRGEVIEPIKTGTKFYLVLCKSEYPVMTKDAYALYDEIGEEYSPFAELLKESLEKDDRDGVVKNLKNDLYAAATRILPEIKRDLFSLSECAPSVMSGSGATVFSVFLDKEERDKAYSVLKKKLKGKLIKAETIG